MLTLANIEAKSVMEVKKLFSNGKLSSPKEIRTYAMLHILSTLGLRPKEEKLTKCLAYPLNV